MALTRLDTEMQNRLVACVESGLTFQRAAQACGIGYSTFKTWMARGRKEKRGIYRDFMAAIKKADAQGEAWHLDNIKEHSAKTWQASAWFLERKFPERWAKRDFKDIIESAVKARTMTREDMQAAFDEVMRG